MTSVIAHHEITTRDKQVFEALDLNNDGRDEGIFSIVYFNNGYFNSRIQSIDFVNDTIITLDQIRTGVNILELLFLLIQSLL